MKNHFAYKPVDIEILESDLASLTMLGKLTQEARDRLAEVARLVGNAIGSAEIALQLANLPEEGVQISMVPGEASALMSLAELAEVLGVTTNTIMAMRKDGRIPQPIHVSKRRRMYRRIDVENWLIAGGAT